MTGKMEVWAPRAGRVEIEIAGTRRVMQQRPGGWWETEDELVRHGADYAFLLDGGRPLPDPRSPWQPQGVHGPSRFLDHTRFTWHDQGWQPPPLAAAEGIESEPAGVALPPDAVAVLRWSAGIR